MGSLLDALIERVAHFTAGRQRGGPLDEFVVNVGVNEGAGAGAAALAHVGEDGVVADRHSLVH